MLRRIVHEDVLYVYDQEQAFFWQNLFHYSHYITDIPESGALVHSGCMLKSVKMVKTTSTGAVNAHLVEALRERLSRRLRVLWLVSGGSAIAVAVAVRQQLGDCAGLAGLSVGLVDERYGAVGHQNSNWQQLRAAGFELAGIQPLPVLAGKSFAATVDDYEAALAAAMSASDYRLGLFGIGVDGHTAGILPDSPAVTSDQLVCGYQGPDYQRITVTPALITTLDEAVACAFGLAKKPALTKLLAGTAVRSEQPAQVLCQVPVSIVYNDQLGESE